MKMSVQWYKECLSNSSKYHKLELEGLCNQFERVLYSISDDEFRQIQIDEAIRQGKDDFDSDKFMKPARLKAMKDAKQRITDQVCQLKTTSTH